MAKCTKWSLTTASRWPRHDVDASPRIGPARLAPRPDRRRGDHPAHRRREPLLGGAELHRHGHLAQAAAMGLRRLRPRGSRRAAASIDAGADGLAHLCRHLRAARAGARHRHAHQGCPAVAQPGRVQHAAVGVGEDRHHARRCALLRELRGAGRLHPAVVAAAAESESSHGARRVSALPHVRPTQGPRTGLQEGGPRGPGPR